ncbi:hypothetical protein HZS_7888 [Henneguya salminicola]|nr:hypothetical protein HZS_7888 [Henneguya salminicola]
MESKWMPKFIATDFEIALINAIKSEFTESIVSGCSFHLKQAIKRKLQKFGVSDTESCTILKNIELVALAPRESISHAIQYLFFFCTRRGCLTTQTWKFCGITSTAFYNFLFRRKMLRNFVEFRGNKAQTSNTQRKPIDQRTRMILKWEKFILTFF